MAYWYCNSNQCDWSGDQHDGAAMCPCCKVATVSPGVIRCPVDGEKLHPKRVALISRQESVSQGDNVASAEPCPRLSHRSASPHTTSSQRFLNRFSAGDSLRAATTFPRAMKNRLSHGVKQ